MLMALECTPVLEECAFQEEAVTVTGDVVSVAWMRPWVPTRTCPELLQSSWLLYHKCFDYSEITVISVFASFEICIWPGDCPRILCFSHWLQPFRVPLGW